MALLINVKDRIPTYPGRVTLTPVAGQENTYDLVRADLPIEQGTPINKVLLDQKAYTLVENVTIYVATTGSDSDGDGTSAAPYATIQKAINDLPKCLGGYHATIDIAEGIYNERVTIDGFFGGRLTLGVAGRSVIVKGMSIMSSSAVRLNISNLTWSSDFPGTMLYVGYSSNVTILADLLINVGTATNQGIGVEQGSILTAASGVTVTARNCGRNAVVATAGGRIAFDAIAGAGNTARGLVAERGGVISYATKTLTSTSGDYTGSGGRILTGGGTVLENASVV